MANKNKLSKEKLDLSIVDLKADVKPVKRLGLSVGLSSTNTSGG